MTSGQSAACLTVRGGTSDDLNALTACILAALRSDAPVAIAAGPGGTTALMVDGEPQVVVSREQGRALAYRATDSVETYLAGLVMHRNFGPWDTHHVPRVGTATRPARPGAGAGCIPVEMCVLCPQSGRHEQRIERRPIPDIAAAVREYPQFVLLGEPGAGKTTVLQKVALNAARTWLHDETAPVPFFVHLGRYRGNERPLDFLAGQWRTRMGTDLGSALRSGSVFLLLDALNEMGCAGYAERVVAWRDFARDWDEVRLIFTCRTRDYDPLGLQCVEISHLDDERVRDFMAWCVPDCAGSLWTELTRHQDGLLDLARNPFLLAVVAWIYALAPAKGVPANRGQLLARLVDRLLGRERKLHSRLDWIEAAAQERALSALAWVLQGQGEGTSLPVDDALRVIPPWVMVQGRMVETKPEVVLRFGCAAALLEETLDGQVRFYHHLIQEYFAARELLRRIEAGEDMRSLWQAPWRARHIPDLTDQEKRDLLSPPLSTGWEETTIVAAGLATSHALVEAVRVVNPILAGRCLSDGGAEVSDDLRERVRSDLLDGMQDRRVRLHVRVRAGHVLGRLGDPRFIVRERDGVRYILPPLVRVPGGSWAIGSPWWDRLAYGDERPRHKVRLAEFKVGQYPVTVAEYRCFVEAGGYQDERYWETERARAWLRGEEIEGGAMVRLLELRQWLLDSGRTLECWAEEWNWNQQTLETWRALMAMTEEEAREVFHPVYADRSRQRPAWWDDSALTGLNQPVVGLTWYEALAYCRWLAEQLRGSGSGFLVRRDEQLASGLEPETVTVCLPTEAEWEVAVRGGSARLYPWGNRFDAARANTAEGRVLATTPVGVYPQGVGWLGLWDGAGNVWEWTSTLYQPYPYRADDGRECLFASGRRVLRGGSWFSDWGYSRCAYRLSDDPDYFGDSVGFRVVFHDTRVGQ
ncbi:MAG: SUMF1/EgtB/PvdO family nonheme iron enzyme [Chloroflexota bacterium]|nr:SUMF1/EgtB/PvdO family nonheme iron enzyme [Chloroflexota bacterium]